MNSVLFRLLDEAGKGLLEKSALLMCVKAYGWTDRQLDNFLRDLNPYSDGSVTEEEFMLICQFVQQKMHSALPPVKLTSARLES